MLQGIALGSTVKRTEVHARFGGRQQGGIGSSKKAPVVLCFTDPESGQRHGYYDGMDADGYFNFVGEGQRGDQTLTQGNRMIRDHVEEGRTLEVFKSRAGQATYLGEFALVDFYFTQAHASGDPTTLRQVVVFRMRPVTGSIPLALPEVPFTKSATTVTEVVPVEQRLTERSFFTPDRSETEMERRESELVHRYREHLISQGHDVQRLRMVPAGESAPLYADLWDITTKDLIEAKSGVTREHVRAAIGQLLDYDRFAGATTRTVLLPSKPRPDLLALLAAVGMAAVWPGAATGTWEHAS